MRTGLAMLVLGATGRLGLTLLERLAAKGHKVRGFTRRDLDLDRPEKIADTLRSVSCDVLINAAGMTSVDACELDPAAAMRSNAESPALLAHHCAATQTQLIHFSSDYVFDGRAQKNLREEDATAPCNVYGRSKRAGEIAVLEAHPGALVVRVSWLFGDHKPSFPDMMLEKALQGGTVSAVADKWSSPTYANDLSDWLELLMSQYPDQRGLLHLCNEGAPTWLEYAQATLDLAAEQGMPLRTREVTGHSMHGFAPFIAQRPPYTALDTDKFHQLTGVKPRAWRDALADYLQRRYPRSA